MNAELIAVGTEILLGDIVNTDAQVISQGLSELGINVYYQTVVGDNPKVASGACHPRSKRPRGYHHYNWRSWTHARRPDQGNACKRIWQEDGAAPAVDCITEFFRKIGREMTPNNEKTGMASRGMHGVCKRMGNGARLRL